MPKNAVQKRLYNAATTTIISGVAGSGGASGNADTVDGFHASSTATANTLYPLGASARFPAAVLPTTVAYYDAAQAWTGVQTFTTGLLLAVDIGPASGQKHALPAVTSDTIALLAASQALTNKTYNGLTITSSTGTLTVAAGKTLTVSNTLTLAAGADGYTLTVPATGTAVLLTATQAITGKTYEGLTITTTTGTFTLASGKTFTVSNTLTLSGTDGKSLALTGSLTVGADTSITGGGTLALAGYTLTVPGTGTLVLNSRLITSGDGLTGGGDLSADRTLAVGAGTGVSVAADAVAVDTTYAFTWSALHTFNAGATIAAGQSLGFGADVALSRKSSDILQLSAGDQFETPTFTSGYVGWRLDADGNAEFNNVVMRGEMRASVFTVGEIHATGGSLLVLPAYLVFEDTTSV